MLHSEQLKTILSTARNHIKDGETDEALKYLDMADMYADFHKFDDPRLTTAIRGLAKILETTEPEALESVALQGFYNLGRAKALGGQSGIKSEIELKKQIIFNDVLPDFGVKPLTRAEQALLLEEMNKKQQKGGKLGK